MFGLWDPLSTCVLNVHIVDTDSTSYDGRHPQKPPAMKWLQQTIYGVAHVMLKEGVIVGLWNNTLKKEWVHM